MESLRQTGADKIEWRGDAGPGCVLQAPRADCSTVLAPALLAPIASGKTAEHGCARSPANQMRALPLAGSEGEFRVSRANWQVHCRLLTAPSINSLHELEGGEKPLHRSTTQLTDCFSAQTLPVTLVGMYIDVIASTIYAPLTIFCSAARECFCPKPSVQNNRQ